MVYGVKREVRMERREEERIPLQVPVLFTGNRVVGKGRLVNISAGGCRVESDKNVQPGMFLNMCVYLAEQDLPLVVELGAVRWTLGQEFGMEFLLMRKEVKGRLRGLIRDYSTCPRH